MKKLAMGALCGFLAACGGGSTAKPDAPVITTDDGGGGTDATAAACNVLAQTGCAAGEKCSWIIDMDGTATSPDLGHIGCAPDGAANVGEACTVGAAGATGYDTCKKGNYCVGGKCKQICDAAGGAPTCGTGFACGKYSGLFGASGMEAAGVCDATCEPLSQNRGDGSANCGGAIGSDGVPTEGCYGYWNDTASGGSKFSCARVITTAKDKKQGAIVGTTGGGGIYINSCYPGYQPLFREATGSNNIICSALCKPADTYMGGPDNSKHNGVTGTGGLLSSCPQRGATAATFDCRYGWWFETDAQGAQSAKGPYSDDLGFCIDVSKYTFTDPANMSNQLPFKLCSALPKAAPSATDPYGSAKDWGCVSHDFVTGFDTGAVRKPELGFRVANGTLTKL